MRDGKFKCPVCGSTHFEHIFPRKKSIPVFLRCCLGCGKYKFWVHKKKKKEANNDNVN